MKRILPLLFFSLSLYSQDISGDQAIAKVFNVLSGKEELLPPSGQRDSLLQIGAWEALAYLEKGAALQDDLREAVPDYYHFKEDHFIFKLIDPNDHNHYGFEGQLKYRWEKNQLLVLSPNGEVVKDRWKLLYLDENYLALAMDDLRVFFTHTRPQET